MTGFLPSFLLVLLAELGDKTQLLALSCAAAYPPRHAVTGVILGIAAVNLLAVLIGERLSLLIPEQVLKLIIATVFVGFGVWTLLEKQKEDGKCCPAKGGISPVLTVAMTFFLAELGDKTQLATMSLAAKYRSLLGVWLGASAGMILADAVAIGAGVLAGKHLPERTIKTVCACIFVLFGVLMFLEAFGVITW
jgi:Ca2+/H+ antiporter, TMEM165/GDT1 family